MSSLVRILTSTVGKKFVMAVTGIAWVLFLISHLLGNLALYRADGAPYNKYSDTLVSMGWILYIAEIGLVILLLGHVYSAIKLKFLNRSARPVGYKVESTKGGPSKKNISSTTMAITGLLILGFVIWHVIQFKYGPGVDQGYVADVDGRQVRDLHRLVVEVFQEPLWVIFYVVGMIVMGLHVRHGFYSAFQTLSIAGNKVSRNTQKLGVALAIILAIGFLLIPVWIYFDMPGRFL